MLRAGPCRARLLQGGKGAPAPGRQLRRARHFHSHPGRLPYGPGGVDAGGLVQPRCRGQDGHALAGAGQLAGGPGQAPARPESRQLEFGYGRAHPGAAGEAGLHSQVEGPVVDLGGPGGGPPAMSGRRPRCPGAVDAHGRGRRTHAWSPNGHAGLAPAPGPIGRRRQAQAARA